MLNPSRRGVLARSIALVAGALACVALTLPSSLHAQAEGAVNAKPLQVHLVATGTGSFLYPYAHVGVSEPAYVAVFEVHPDVGAVMLYPFTGTQRGRVARSVSFDLSDMVLDQYRQEFRQLTLPRFQYASQVRTRGYLVAIASRRPLDTSLLEAGRFLEASGGMAEPYDIVDQLVSLIVPAQPAGDWSYDIYGFFKDQNRALAYLMSPGYMMYERALLGYPNAFCYASPNLAYFSMFGSAFYGPCGLTPYGWYSSYGAGLGYGGWYGWGWGWGWGYRPGTPREQPRTAGPVDTRGMTPGTPRQRDRARVVDDAPGSAVVAGKVAEGRDRRVAVTGPSSSKPVAGPVAEPRPGRKGVTDAKKKTDASRQDPVDAAERFREILDQLGDARSTAAIGPATLIDNRAAFTRAGLRPTPHLAFQMEAQAIEAQRRLEHRLRSMGVPAREAAQTAGQSGAAPRIDYLGGGAPRAVRSSAPRQTSGSSRPATAGRPTSVHGASRVQRAHVSRPAPPRPRPVSRPAPRPAPRTPVHTAPREPRPHQDHGGGGGHGHR